MQHSLPCKICLIHVQRSSCREGVGPVCTESHCVCMVILYTPGPECMPQVLIGADGDSCLSVGRLSSQVSDPLWVPMYSV